MFELRFERPKNTWDIFQEMEKIQNDFDRIFSSRNRRVTQDSLCVNIWTSDEDVVMRAELPGINPEKLNISVTGDTVTLRGAYPVEERKEDETYHRKERNGGSFNRVFQLPFRVEAEKVLATYQKGILSVTLPRAEADKPRKIELKTV